MIAGQKGRMQRQLSRAYASIQTSQFEGGAIVIDPSIYKQITVKAPTSKKSLMHAEYVDFYKSNPTLLVLQHNNLTQAQLLSLRSEFKAVGARLRIIRVGIFQHAIRIANLQVQSKKDSDIQQLDVNSTEIHRKIRRAPKKSSKTPDLTQLLTGPVCTITFPSDPKSRASLSPEVLKKTISIIAGTKNQLMLLGGKYDNRIFALDSLQEISKLPDLDTLRGQLLSLLGASAFRITQILGSPASLLGRTIEGRKVALEEAQGK